jgi:hypothetical protein
MKYIKIICLFTLLFVASGCKKWLDVNSDPATPQDVDPEFFLAPIIARMAVSTGTEYMNAQFKYTQFVGAQVEKDILERHGWTTSDNTAVLWRFAYVDAGLNIEDMIRKSEAKGNNTLAGISYAIKAWGYQMTTDSHGPIVLDEALKDQLSFKYNDQPDVYNKVREWCYIALQKLNTPDVLVDGARLKTNDYLFGSYITTNTNLTAYRAQWKKFVYAILATQYSHLINKPDFKTKYADSVIKFVDLSFGGTVFNASEDACINFDNVSSANANPMSTAGGLPNSVANTLNTAVANVGSGRVAQPVVSYLTGGMRGTPAVNPTSSTDPRLTRMIAPSGTTIPVGTPVVNTPIYKGVIPVRGDIAGTKTVPHMLGSITNSATALFPGKYIFGNGLTDKSRWPLYTYAQLQFAKAEAQFIKGDAGLAWTAYDRGIRGHMDFVNRYGLFGNPVGTTISGGEITTYMASSEVAQNAAQLTIADIMGQKYVAQWGWAGQEEWCDLRKYLYDPLVFRQYKQLDLADFTATVTVNGGSPTGLYAFRLRPRFNSEYVWNRGELDKWGGLLSTYSYTPTWFVTKNN